MTINEKMQKFMLITVISILAACESKTVPVAEPTKASQSPYNNDIRRANTSQGLTKADLAWHALKTYGWDCAEVVSRGQLTAEGYFVIECKSGKKLHVYPRPDQHPRITNEDGNYN